MGEFIQMLSFRQNLLPQGIETGPFSSPFVSHPLGKNSKMSIIGQLGRIGFFNRQAIYSI